MSFVTLTSSDLMVKTASGICYGAIKFLEVFTLWQGMIK
jgi:hypothetical protein